MSNAVSADITIDAPPEQVWNTVMDVDKMPEWVTIHRRMLSADDGPPREGMKMEQCLALRGASFKVKWKLVECDDGVRAVWEGKGPVGSSARTSYELTENAEGNTAFHYENEFKAPMGPLGKAAGRVLVGGLPQKEAHASLQKLKSLIER